MSESSEAVVVLSTASTSDEAATIARGLVGEKLAACVNIVPGVRSIYSWDGALQDDSELLLVIKTRADRQEAVVSRIQELHSYDCPEAIVLPIRGGSKPYLTWLAEVTQ